MSRDRTDQMTTFGLRDADRLWCSILLNLVMPFRLILLLESYENMQIASNVDTVKRLDIGAEVSNARKTGHESRSQDSFRRNMML